MWNMNIILWYMNNCSTSSSHTVPTCKARELGATGKRQRVTVNLKRFFHTFCFKSICLSCTKVISCWFIFQSPILTKHPYCFFQNILSFRSPSRRQTFANKNIQKKKKQKICNTCARINSTNKHKSKPLKLQRKKWSWRLEWDWWWFWMIVLTC